MQAAASQAIARPSVTARRPSSTGSDSDDSETLLPWARASAAMSSDDERNGRDDDPITPTTQVSSPTDTRTAPNSANSAVRKPPTGIGHHAHSPSQDSSSTEDSEDPVAGEARRNQTFSIYDVYGRDSVALANFDVLARGVEGVSVSDGAGSFHPMPAVPENYRQGGQSSSGFTAPDLANRLKSSSSGRRPSAAPDPRAVANRGPGGPGAPASSMASSIRQQVEGSNASFNPQQQQQRPPGPPQQMPQGPQGGAPPMSFDPRRRPAGPPAGPVSPALGSGPPVRPGLGQLHIPGREYSNGPSPSGGPGMMHTGPGRTSTSDSSNSARRSPNEGHSPTPSAGAGSLGSPTSAQFRPGVHNPMFPPIRGSSDRDRAAGQLRNTPSGASRTSGYAASSNDSSARSASPLTATGPMSAKSADRLPSPGGLSGSRTNSPAPSNASSNRSGVPRCDAKGFFLNPKQPPCRPEIEDAETLSKWNAILKENDPIGAKKSRKVKKLIRGGVPNSLRGKVWLFLANAGVRRRDGLFEQLCHLSGGPKGKKGKETIYDSIEKDIARTYPDNKFFLEGSPGKADMEAILKAYVHYNPTIGYTQGMGFLVGMFLLHMPPEDAFWLLCALLRDIHMADYYSEEMKQMHIDGVVFGQLLQTMDPKLADKLQTLGIEPLHFTPNWFLPLFCRVLPWPTLMRVWDLFFFEGPNWVLQVSLSIVRIIREPLMATSGASAREDCMMLLLHPPAGELNPENVVTCALTVKLKEGEMRRLSRNASQLVRDGAGIRGRNPMTPVRGPGEGPSLKK